jgi:pyroglutamyl-peptidase
MPVLKKIKVLVTGFGPFPGMRSNPSGDLLRWIEERHIRLSRNIQLETATIPTRWNEVEHFTSGMLSEFDPDIALHFGVHSRATILRVEKLARNCSSTQADAAGEIATHHCVIDGAPQTLKSTLDTDKLVTELRARGLPAQSSTNAGRYICNALLFASLHQAEKRPLKRETGFIHIPQINAHGMDRNLVLKGAEVIISHCVRTHIHQTLMRA